MLSRLLNNILHVDLEKLCSAFSWLTFIKTKDSNAIEQLLMNFSRCWVFLQFVQRSAAEHWKQRSNCPSLFSLFVSVDFSGMPETCTVTFRDTSRKYFFCFTHSVLSRLCMRQLCALHGEVVWGAVRKNIISDRFSTKTAISAHI